MSTPPINMAAGSDGVFSAVPGGQPPPSAPPAPGVAGPQDQVAMMTKRIMQALAQNAQRKQFAGTPTAAPIPGRQDPTPPGYMQKGPQWGGLRFMHGLQASIQNAVSAKKKRDLTKAEADWTYMSSALNELYAAQASGDPKAVAEAQSKVDVVMSDPKKLKAMAKALNQDWLNPEKTTVYGEALKKVTAKTEQTSQQKQQAAQGIKGLFQKLLQSKQQPQLTPEQQQQMSREIQSKAPTTSAGTNVKDMREGALAIMDIEKAAKEARENYAFQVAPDGKVWAINKTNPKDAFQVRDAETGKEVTGQTKTGAAPKVLSAKGVPYGIQRGGKILTPETEGWTKDDQTLYDAAIGASKEAQQLRINPIVADQVGAPPDPSDYKKGRKDPEYAKDLRTYGLKAEAVDDRMKSASAIARAKAQNDYKIVEVTDYDQNGDPVTHFTTGKAALEGGLSSATQGAKNLSRSKQIEDIQVSSEKLRDAVTNIDKPFSPKQIAVMQEALKAGDESIASAEFQALANEQLTDKQFQAALWIKHLNERAMSLRNIAGMGQGAQDTRDAIRSLLPNMGTGDAKRMTTMLDAFDNQVKILGSGVPKAGGQVKAEATKKASEAANMETQTYNGATYQRKKGSSDEWTLAPKAQ